MLTRGLISRVCIRRAERSETRPMRQSMWTGKGIISAAVECGQPEGLTVGLACGSYSVSSLQASNARKVVHQTR